MKIIDITLPLYQEKTTYPSIDALKVEWLRRIEDGKNVSLSKITLTSHLGTHVDAPSHLLLGEANVENIPLEKLIGKAAVMDVTSSSPAIDADFLAEKLKNYPDLDIVLLKTGFKSPVIFAEEFNENYSYLTTDAVEVIIDNEISTLGIDTPNVDSYTDKSMPNHKKLLGKGIVIVESLKLNHISPGIYKFVGLPLRVIGTEGAPMRAILIKE